MADPPFLAPVIVVFGFVAGFFIFFMIFMCFKMWKESMAHQPQEPTRNRPIPPPPTAPPVPIAPPLILASDPPPYSEVVDKPYFYPAPVGQPPCYDNIATEALSSP